MKHRRPKVKPILSSNPIGCLTPRSAKAAAQSSLNGSTNSSTPRKMSSQEEKQISMEIAAEGKKTNFLSKPLLPPYSFFLPTLPLKSIVIHSEQPVSARDSSMNIPFASLQKAQESKEEMQSEQAPSPRIRRTYGYPDLVPKYLENILYELCLDATLEEGHLLLASTATRPYCRHAEWQATSQDKLAHQHCLHVKEEEEYNAIQKDRTNFLLPERCGELTGGTHDHVLAKQPSTAFPELELFDRTFGGTTSQLDPSATFTSTARTSSPHRGEHSKGGLLSSTTTISSPLVPPAVIHNNTFAKALSRMDLRPGQIQRAWEAFDGDRTGFVAVKTVIHALMNLFTDEKLSEVTFNTCFQLFTRPDSTGRIRKCDLDAKRSAVTEKDGCSRLMIVTLIRAIAQCERFPSDKRQFISYEEFKRFMLGEEGALSGDLVVAFLPKLLQLIDELRVMQRRQE